MVKAPLKFKANASSGLPLLILGAIAVAAGFTHRSAGAVALGAALAAGPVAVYVLLRRSLAGLAVRRSAPLSAFEGDSIEVRLEIENRSRLSVFYPTLSEIFAPELHAQKDVLFAQRLRPAETLSRSYRGDCMLPRGIYAIGPTAVSVSDPFGWFRLRRKLEGQASIKVYPRVQALAVEQRLGERVSRLLEERTRLGLGESSEFFSVREYRPGDALRRVHWRLSAHLGYPVVREYARPASGDLSIFLDLNRRALIGIGRASSIEYAVKIAASLAARSLRNGHRVHLAAGEGELDVPLGAGNLHFLRILDLLVRVKPRGELTLPELLDRRAREVRPGATVVLMISPYLQGSRGLEAHCRTWRRQGVRVLAVVFDPSTFHTLWSAPGPEARPKDHIARLRSWGVEPHELACGAGLEHLLPRARS
jgi:uncharacterized protein (DUF58 family)